MIIDCKGFKVDNFIIPPFQLNRGEIVTLNLLGGGHFFYLEQMLVEIFTQEVQSPNVQVNAKLLFAQKIKLPFWKEKISPMTIGDYLKKNAHSTDIPFSIFKEDKLHSKTKISHLPENPKKLLSIYSVLTKCEGLIFDLVGNDPIGAARIYDVVENFVISRNGYAILLNNFNDMEKRSMKHYQIELFGS